MEKTVANRDMNLQNKTETRWVVFFFQSAAESRLNVFLICDAAENHKHKQVCVAPLVARPYCAPGVAPRVRGGQQVQQTTTKSGGAIWSRQAGGEGGEGSCDSEFSKQKLVQRKKRKRENDFGRTFLKLCWMMIGWLPPLAFPVSDTDSSYTLFTYLTIFTLHWLEERRCSVRFSSWTQPSRNASSFEKKCVSISSRGKHGRKKEVMSERL